MPLIDLKTNLKSLKYGFDRPNMGSSKEPFITKPIPDGDISPNTPDFILRDGALKRGFEDISRLTQLFTTFRGLKFTTNTNLLAAQNPKIPGAPRNLYLPTSTLAQVGVNAIGTHLNLLGETPFDLPSTNVNLGNLSLNLGGNTYYKEYKNNFSQPEDNRLVILSRRKIGLEKDSNSQFSKILRVNDLNATKYGVALSNDNLILSYIGGPGAGITGLNTTINRTEFTVGSKGYSGEEISTSKSNSKNQVANSIEGLNLFNTLGATTKYFSFSGLKISGIEVPNPSEEIIGINSENGSQLKVFGPQSTNSTLSTLSKSSQLVSSSLEFSSNVTSLKTLSSYKNLLGASKVYDEKNSVKKSSTAPFTEPGVDRSGFNDENQQLKRYGPLDNNIVPDSNYLDYRYQGTPDLRENKDSSLYEVGRQGLDDMLVSPTSPYGQTFFPNYTVINAPFKGEKDFNTIRNNKDHFNRYNTERLNLSKFGDGRKKVLTPNLNGADGKTGEDDGIDITTSEGQLFPFILNLIDAESPGTNQYLYWQAYIDSFSDRIEASYDNYEYPGYGTPFYKYKSFNREISLDFTIEVPHPDQMANIYLKLQELIRHLAPNYSQGGYLRGNFVKLTFGDYLRDTPCILKGFSIEPIFDAGFDTGRTAEWASRGKTSGYQLPKVLKLSGFNFTVLADNNNQLIRKDSTFISSNKNPLN
jgi:hypothetical protein